MADRALADDIINASEAQLLKDTEAGRLRTINVDDFTPEELVFHSKALVKDKPTKRPKVKIAQS